MQWHKIHLLPNHSNGKNESIKGLLTFDCEKILVSSSLFACKARFCSCSSVSQLWKERGLLKEHSTYPQSLHRCSLEWRPTLWGPSWQAFSCKYKNISCHEFHFITDQWTNNTHLERTFWIFLCFEAWTATSASEKKKKKVSWCRSCWNSVEPTVQNIHTSKQVLFNQIKTA